MKLVLAKGKYVVAVSGGVDSVSLLNMLSDKYNSYIVRLSDNRTTSKPGLHQETTMPLSNYATIQLVVAHFDHGIRPDSKADRLFVQSLAKKYGLPFEYAEGKLGPEASEATARTARYQFLRRVQKKHQAKAIITAHHQDDVIETAFINLLRGTGRKGLTSLDSKADVLRPLLELTKAEILAYAKQHKLQWRDDVTNEDTKYLRNYVRRELIPKLHDAQRRQLLGIIKRQRSVNAQLDVLLLKGQEGELKRQWFIGLPHAAAREVMAAWLRANGVREFDRATIERAVVGAKTAKTGKKVALKGNTYIKVGKGELALKHIER